MERPAMKKPPLWFSLIVGVALLWNLAGLLAVVADIRLTAAAIAALPAQQQALYAARPFWSVIASVVAVGAGTLGCISLLIRKKWALILLFASLFGVVLQDIGIFLIAGAARVPNPVPFVLQGIVLLVALGLIALAHRATRNAWLQ
jgi:hypothetical protein